MKRALLKCSLPLMILLGSSSNGRAQESLSPQLSKIAQTIEGAAKESLPEWRFERGTPMLGSTNVLIEFAVSCGRSVKVSVLPFASDAEARQAVHGFARSSATKTELRGIGDEAYAWGYSDAIAFRKGTLAVFVSAASDIDRLVLSLNQAERETLKRNEEVALNKSFARIIAAVLSAPPLRSQRDIYGAPSTQK